MCIRDSTNNSTGQLSFASAPSYEAPADSGGNNVYDVTVQVSDGQGGTDDVLRHAARLDLRQHLDLRFWSGNQLSLIHI